MRPAKFLCFAPVAKRKGIRDFFFALSSFFVSFVSFAFFQFIANKCFLNLLRLCWGLCVPHRPAFFRVSDEKLRPIHNLAHGKKQERKKKEKIFSAFDSNYRINHKCEYPFSSIRTRGIVRPKRDRLHGLKKRSKRGKQPKTTPTADGSMNVWIFRCDYYSKTSDHILQRRAGHCEALGFFVCPVAVMKTLSRYRLLNEAIFQLSNDH